MPVDGPQKVGHEDVGPAPRKDTPALPQPEASE